MNAKRLNDRLAACSWSFQPAGPAELIEGLHQSGVHRVQLALDPLRTNPSLWSGAADRFRDAGVTVVSGMAGCVGEDYSTLETIRHTGGLVRDEHWTQNLENFQRAADLAAGLGLTLVTLHAGFVPHTPADPGFHKMVDRLVAVARVFAGRGLLLGLETGQETAPDLGRLLGELNGANVGVNFDPANMLLYGKGDPVEAVRLLLPHIRQVHIKDARRTLVPGTWGEEVTVGTGEVDWRAFFEALAGAGREFDLVIEREAGCQRAVDIRAARVWVEKVLAELAPLPAAA